MSKKIKYIVVVLMVVIVGLFVYKVYRLNNSVKDAVGNFDRNIVDSIDISKNTWHVIPQANKWNLVDGLNSFYIAYGASIKKDKQSYSWVSFYPGQNESDIIGTAKFDSVYHFVYQDLQQWIRFNPHTKEKKITKLPSYTLRSSIIDAENLLVRYFDYDDKKNKLAILDTTGKKVQVFSDIFSIENDGGLSIDCTLLQDDQNIYCISQYTNFVIKVNIKTGKVDRFTTIEKIDKLPEVTQHVNSYSFKTNPYWVHPNAKLLDSELYVLSTINDKESVLKQITKSCFIDIYDKNLKYIKSLLLKNIEADDITDFLIFDNQLILTKGVEELTTNIAI